VRTCSSNGLQRTDRDDRGLAGGDFARDDRLQTQHGRGGHDDRVDAGLGHRPVRAAAEQPDLEAVGGGLGRAGPVADRARRGGHDVLAEDHLRLGEAVEEAVVDHRLCALGRLLRGLEDGQHGALPGVAGVGEQPRRARQPGDVHVVAARVHDRDLVPGGVGRRRGAGVRQAGRLPDRQRVHVGAQHDRGAVAVCEQSHDAGSADPCRPSSRQSVPQRRLARRPVPA
jgi:hypothetical protein